MKKMLALVVLTMLFVGACSLEPIVVELTATIEPTATIDPTIIARKTQFAEWLTAPRTPVRKSQSKSSRPVIPCCGVWNNTVTADPIAWVKGPGLVNVYGGVSSPQKDDVKGTITPGAAFNVECSEMGWYRVRGIDWWGWLKPSDIEW